MQAKTIAVATDRDLADLDDSWPLLLDALAGERIEASVVVWDDSAVDWSRFDLVLASYMWGYVFRRLSFLAWVEHTAKMTTLVNPARALTWNSDKGYLADLAAEGVPIVPTAFVRPGEKWRPPGDDFVVKPSVASGGIGAARYTSGDRRAAELHVRRLHAAGNTVMVQPYQSAVDIAGETALVFLGGTYSHSLRKKALLVPGVGEVDHLWEQAVISAAAPSDDQRLLAEAAFEAVGRRAGPVSYARVDVVPGAEGGPLVLEVEVIEPSLFLTHEVAAAARFATVLRRLTD